MIVRDGWPFILVGLVLTVAFMISALKWDSFVLLLVTAVVVLLTAFTTFFFRSPQREIPEDPRVLVSPADGKIVAITPLENHPHVGGPVVRVSIFLSVFDVHVNRVPTAGTIDYVKYNPGKFLAAFVDKASDLNEQTEIGMTTTGGHKLVFTQIAGFIARRIVCRLQEGEQVSTGQLFGMIRFGSRTDLIVPADWEIAVALGDRVKGGSSIIGFLPDTNHNSQAAEAVSKDNVEL